MEVSDPPFKLCPYCTENVIIKSARDAFDHLFKQHYSGGIHIRCDMIKCQSKVQGFITWDSFRRHYRNAHLFTASEIRRYKFALIPQPEIGNEFFMEDERIDEEVMENDPSVGTYSEGEELNHDEMFIPLGGEGSTNVGVKICEREFVKEVMLLITEMAGFHRVSYTGQQKLFDSIKKLTKLLVGDNSAHYTALTCISTRRKREVYQTTELGYVTPKAAILYEKQRGRNRIPKKISFYYTPLEEALKQMLKCDRVKKWAIEGGIKVKHPDKGGQCYDGFYKPTRSKDGKVILHLMGSYDGVNFTNTLGIAKSTRKLGVAYIELLCVPPAERAGIGMKRFIFAVEAQYLKERPSAWDQVWSNIIETVKKSKLEGLLLTDDPELRFEICLEMLPCDNLAAHEVLCFKGNFSKVREPCRFCRIKLKDDMPSVFESRQNLLRTTAQYTENMEILRTARRENKPVPVSVPFISESPLTGLDNFSVWLFVIDVMHTILEGGWLTKIFTLFVRYITTPVQRNMPDDSVQVDEEYIKFRFLNDIIDHWTYPKPGDKPCRLPETMRTKSDVRMKAAAFYQLAQQLPFMVLGRIPENNKYLLNYCKTLQVCMLLLSAPVVNERSLDQLDVHVPSILAETVALYGDSFIVTSKIHLLTHICTLVRLYSMPPRSMSCFRYEAAYRRLKLKNYTNFINLSKTVAMYVETLHMLDTINEEETVKTKLCNSRDYSDYNPKEDYQHLLKSSMADDVEMRRVNEVCIGDTKLAHGTVVELTHPTEPQPVFGEIDEIFISGGSFYICMQRYRSAEFLSHLCSYELADPCPHVIQLKDLYYVLVSPSRYDNLKLTVIRKNSASLEWFCSNTEDDLEQRI